MNGHREQLGQLMRTNAYMRTSKPVCTHGFLETPEIRAKSAETAKHTLNCPYILTNLLFIPLREALADDTNADPNAYVRMYASQQSKYLPNGHPLAEDRNRQACSAISTLDAETETDTRRLDTMTTNGHTSAPSAAELRREIQAHAEHIADWLDITPQAALREVYGGPPSTRVYGGPPDECGDEALEGVLFTAVYLVAALRSGVSWAVAKQTLAAARSRHRPPRHTS
jgi:hypothetical protein